MPCPSDTTIQYNIDLHTDPVGGQVNVEGHFTFCLKIEDEAITGLVEELSEPLTGTNEVLGPSDVHRISLQFFWEPSQISLEGFTYPESGNRREFLGRFNASAPEGLLKARAVREQLLQGPDSGDTGTATGTQT